MAKKVSKHCERGKGMEPPFSALQQRDFCEQKIKELLAITWRSSLCLQGAVDRLGLPSWNRISPKNPIVDSLFFVKKGQKAFWTVFRNLFLY